MTGAIEDEIAELRRTDSGAELSSALAEIDRVLDRGAQREPRLRERWRPARFSVKALAGMPEVEEASGTSGGVAASSRAKVSPAASASRSRSTASFALVAKEPTMKKTTSASSAR